MIRTTGNILRMVPCGVKGKVRDHRAVRVWEGDDGIDEHGDTYQQVGGSSSGALMADWDCEYDHVDIDEDTTDSRG